MIHKVRHKPIHIGEYTDFCIPNKEYLIMTYRGMVQVQGTAELQEEINDIRSHKEVL